MKAHDDLTFTEIGATMAYYDLTFNVIGATIESPSQNPLACLYKRRVCGNQAELLRRNLCHVSRSPRGWVGGQQAHLSSGPLGFAEGSSTASLSAECLPHYSTQFWKFWSQQSEQKKKSKESKLEKKKQNSHCLQMT